MLAKEVLASVEVIRDPYVRAVTYARIGEKLARRGNPLYKEAFLRAVDTAEHIDNPAKMLKALLYLAYSMRKAGLKAYGKIHQKVMESLNDLPQVLADDVLRTAVMYSVSLGRIEEALEYALAIKTQEIKDNALLAVVRKNTAMIEEGKIKVAYRIRKSKLAVEYIKDETVRSKALLEIIKSYMIMESYSNAISTILNIGSREWAKHAFKEVAMALSSRGVLSDYSERLIEVANKLIERFNSNFRVELAVALSIAGEGRKAAELIRSEGKKDSVQEILEVARRLFEIDRQALISFIKGLRLSEARAVGKVILNMVLESADQIDSSFVVSVAKLSRSEEVWAKAARYLVQIGNVKEAWKIASSLNSERLRSIVLAGVAHRLLKEGRVENAIDAALDVRDSRISSLLVAEILVSALDLTKEREMMTDG